MCMQTRKYLQYNVLEGAGTSEGNSTQYPGPAPPVFTPQEHQFLLTCGFTSCRSAKRNCTSVFDSKTACRSCLKRSWHVTAAWGESISIGM